MSDCRAGDAEQFGRANSTSVIFIQKIVPKTITNIYITLYEIFFCSNPTKNLIIIYVFVNAL